MIMKNEYYEKGDDEILMGRDGGTGCLNLLIVIASLLLISLLVL